MKKLVSAEVREAIVAIDAVDAPTAEQIATLKTTMRALLLKVEGFALRVEKARMLVPNHAPLWGLSCAGTEFYRSLAEGAPAQICGSIVIELSMHRPGGRA